jgi:hypothetical protein
VMDGEYDQNTLYGWMKILKWKLLKFVERGAKRGEKKEQ